jgi:hypothetical protein
VVMVCAESAPANSNINIETLMIPWITRISSSSLS